MTTQDEDYARENASGWMESIQNYLSAIDCDYDRLEELKDELTEAHEAEGNDIPFDTWLSNMAEDENGTLQEAAQELKELIEAADEYTSQENACTAARESILDLQVRSDWHAPGDGDNTPTEFLILLSTGGPALRVLGELDQYNEPSRAWLEYQDWGTPWTEYFGDNFDAEAVIRFASLFYFGE